MKKGDLIDLLMAINSVADVKGVKFAYGLARNKKIIQAELKVINESVEKLSPELQKVNSEFELRRIALAGKFAVKNNKGLPIKQIIGGREKFQIADSEGFQKELDKLKENYKELFEELNRLEEVNNPLMEEDVDIKLFKIKQVDFHDELSLNQLEPIMELIE